MRIAYRGHASGHNSSRHITSHAPSSTIKRSRTIITQDAGVIDRRQGRRRCCRAVDRRQASGTPSMQLSASLECILHHHADTCPVQIEFPSILLPPDIHSGSIVDINVARNHHAELLAEQNFSSLQQEVIAKDKEGIVVEGTDRAKMLEDWTGLSYLVTG